MIIITGGGSGIGRALAQTLAEKGERVLVVGRRKKALETTALASVLIDTLEADLSTSIGQQALLDRAHQENALKAIVHNAGTLGAIMPLAQLSLKHWRETFKLNVEAPLFITQALLASFKNFRALNIALERRIFRLRPGALTALLKLRCRC